MIDQARAWSEATGGNLRQYLQWVEQQTAEGARVAEAVLPETDDDAVRIMTIHAAKGLEFPITIVSGHVDRAQSAGRAPAEVVFPPDRRGRATGFGKHVHDRRVRGVAADRRADGVPTSGSGCSTWRAPGPATTWSCRCTARPERGHRTPPNSAPTPSCWSTGMGEPARRAARRRRRDADARIRRSAPS